MVRNTFPSLACLRPRKYITIAIVSCTYCINNGVECYYSREQSVSCAECILKHRKCDGSFSLEELRKVEELKKAKRTKRRQKLSEISKLRKAMLEAQKALAEAEEEQVSIEESIAELDDRTERILKRKILALGVFNRVSDEQEVALGDSDMSWLDHNFHVQQVD
ncbi:hypothetical protein LTR70_007244 [Exophiala xenobiotica]|uniref:B box-type domain-containing protein n=1 Tax=Lithohypha guttulata TaxID=1690604 RepID=A0ABR0K593_9EURO|nr:hypothetical protein LTR24_006828 [Lithohypha guttulata]KAK5314270.1 hypothetical protein LTR70_007244 [Exophiala xenobiotica]